MICSIEDRHFTQQERIDALKATDVIGVLVRIQPSLVMSMDSAYTTEVVLRNFGVELVHPQMLLPLDNSQCTKWNEANNGALPAAHRAVAALRFDYAIRQVDFQYH